MKFYETTLFNRAMYILVFLLIVFLAEKVSFVFYPVIVLFRVFFVPIAFAIVLYYIFNPVVNWLEKKKVKRVFGVTLLFVAVIVLLIASSLLFGSTLEKQFIKVAEYIPDLPDRINDTFKQVREHPFFDRFEDSNFLFFERFSEIFSNAVTELFSRAGSDISSIFSAVSNTVIGIVLIPVFLFYMLLDASDIRKKFIILIPKNRREKAEKIITEVDSGLNAFIQGRVIVSFFVAGLTYFGFLFVGVEAPLVLAMILFITNFIPYVGPILGGIPAIAIALLASFSMAVQITILMIVVQQVEGILISPQVMSKKLSIHPLVVLITIMLGGHFAGILGIIFAVPFYVIVKVLITNMISEPHLELSGPKEQ